MMDIEEWEKLKLIIYDLGTEIGAIELILCDELEISEEKILAARVRSRELIDKEIKNDRH